MGSGDLVPIVTVRHPLTGRLHWLWHKLRMLVRNEPEWCCERCRDAGPGQ